MRSSRFYFYTLKEIPAEAETPSHQLMLRAGLIRQLAAGIYIWLPLGIRVLKKVETIIRQEMENIGAHECLMPMIQPSDLWQETGRWQAYGPELLRLADRNQRNFCLGPTHEEVITDLIRHTVRSYKQLPIVLYQIQTKVRDEIRPRFGIMRAREFLMKDAYSFHESKASLEATYNQMYHAYRTIFNRLGLTIKVVQADTGSIGGHTSHEFQVLSEVGEDVIFYDESSDYAINEELTESQSTQHLKSARGIEVGHIFQLGDKYSQAMQASVMTQTGVPKILEMGCYGIGVSRIVAASIEQHHDEKGICWPKAIAPFQVVIVPIDYQKAAIKEAADRYYELLKQANIEVLLEDRKARFGVVMAEMDLMGVSHRLIVSQTGLTQKQVQYKSRKGEEQWLDESQMMHFITTRVLNDN